MVVPAEELDRDYRGEQALTAALMGLLAEDALIARGLSRLPRESPQPGRRPEHGAAFDRPRARHNPFSVPRGRP
jgi:hypothetical protein